MEMLRLWNFSTAYYKRPSEIVGVEDEWAAYQFDAAVMRIGRKVENALSKNASAPKKKRKPVEVVIMKTLGLEPEAAGLQYGSLSDQVTGSVKVKPGEDWFEAIRRYEREKGAG